jgi:acetyl esterase/lipase
VSSSDAVVRRFDELDAWTRSRTAAAETISYGRHEDQVVDIRRPPGEPRGVVLVIHGGFWRHGFTRRNTAALATALTEAGWTTANVEYRRLGPGSYRATFDDLRTAGLVLDRGGTVIAVGHSAGGQLALWLAAERSVDAAVALGAVCDLAAAAEACLGDGAVHEFLGGTPTDVPDAYCEADPSRRLPLRVPHVLVHGILDDRVPIEHARAYAAQARAMGDDCRLVEIDADHFDPIDPRTVAWHATLGALEDVAQSVKRRAA